MGILRKLRKIAPAVLAGIALVACSMIGNSAEDGASVSVRLGAEAYNKISSRTAEGDNIYHNNKAVVNAALSKLAESEFSWDFVSSSPEEENYGWLCLAYRLYFKLY